jgi:hypothetical protein
MTDLIYDHIRVGSPAHSEKPVSPARRLIDRIVYGSGPLDKLLSRLQRRKAQSDDFYHPTSGMAAAFLGLLRNQVLQTFRVAPESFPLRVEPESFLCDEAMARAMAVSWMMVHLAKRIDASFEKRFPPFEEEMCKAQILHELGFEEDAQRRIRKAAALFKAARSADIRLTLLYVGWSLEQNFDLRAPKFVAELVKHAFAMPGRVNRKEERRVRHLCGW